MTSCFELELVMAFSFGVAGLPPWLLLALLLLWFRLWGGGWQRICCSLKSIFGFVNMGGKLAAWGAGAWGNMPCKPKAAAAGGNAGKKVDRQNRKGFGGVVMLLGRLPFTAAALALVWLGVCAGVGWCCRGCVRVGVTLVESQNRLCFDSEVTVLKLWPHLLHFICIRQSACMRLWRHKLENCVYALKQTSHWNGLTEECMCVCCLRPDDVANVLPHSGQAWLLAPMWCLRICRCKFEGSQNTWRRPKINKQKKKEEFYFNRVIDVVVFQNSSFVSSHVFLFFFFLSLYI